MNEFLSESEELPTIATSVEIETEAIGKRQRRLQARIAIAHSPEYIWQVLTDYETLPEFLPNLVTSKRLEHPEGGIRLEQVGKQRLMRVNFKARVVLDLVETFPQEIRFEMVEGDFKEFSGSWELQPLESQTQLCYKVLVFPPRTMPVGLIERRLSQDLSDNLVAIQQRVEELFA